MEWPFGRIVRPKISDGTLKAMIFLLLVALTLAFWFYIQNIFDHIRQFQKSVVSTHVQIYAKIIDPMSNYDSELIDLFEPVVMQAPFPSVFTDTDMNPIEGLWHNVGVAPSDTTRESMQLLQKLAAKMDSVNPPEHIYIPGLEARTDTLTIYEIPYAFNAPVVITDQLSNFIYSRNIRTDPNDAEALKEIILALDKQGKPLTFQREDEPTLIFHHLGTTEAWPMIIVRNRTEPIYWRDIVYSVSDTTDAGNPRLAENIRYLIRNGISYDIVTYNVPIQHERLFHYGDLPFLTMIGWLPVIELAVALILLFIGFIGLINIKNAEQQSIWVGMAKETAHQLGTPISSLSGWFELLRTDQSEDMVRQALPDMEYDVRRLTRVAARFSSVGSKPELKPIVLPDVITEVLDYYRARLPRMGKPVVIEGEYADTGSIMGNSELLNWAFENLIKNALSAIETTNGRISVEGSMSKDFRHVILDFRDNGKGIPSNIQKKVMKPGFTTKKRGWGLGLSLVKRIIEEYHGGKVFLLESRVGDGATFRVILPALRAKRS